MKQASAFWQLKKMLYEIKWKLHAKDPFGNPNAVLEYLGRYTHKIAISNYRIKAIGEDSVTFTYLDRADKNKQKTMTLTADKFISRFL